MFTYITFKINELLKDLGTRDQNKIENVEFFRSILTRDIRCTLLLVL